MQSLSGKSISLWKIAREVLEANDLIIKFYTGKFVTGNDSTLVFE